MSTHSPLSPLTDRRFRPYTRWWWLAGPFTREGITRQLDWVKANGFGGVELAWLHPAWLSLEPAPRPAWLGTDWSELIGFTKAYADEIGLGCDFTFGSCWPFGGRCVEPEDAAQDFFAPSSQRLALSWEEADDPSLPPGRIVNHLSSVALRRYANCLGPAFAPGLRGGRSALFCDSLEIHTDALWSPELWDVFFRRFGYRLEPFAGSLADHADVRYDYRVLISDTIRREFYEVFTSICHELGAESRVQCHGAPTDLLAAYACADVPESEALLFPPHFSRIPASAAALAGKPLVSCETFTCIYGFITPGYLTPLLYRKREQVSDLKLLADAVFANGVSRIVWHGMPFNPPGGKNEFFASVHVGPDGGFAAELPRFNRYLETVSAFMGRGRPYANLGIYLPLEDNRMRSRLPPEDRTPGAVNYWELRQETVPAATLGFHPLWVSAAFLKDSHVEDGVLHVGAVYLSALYVNCEWMEREALGEILRLAREGMFVVLARRPREPGHIPHADYEATLSNLVKLPCVVPALDDARIVPLVSGEDLPWFWARETEDGTLIFFAHPKARTIRYPLSFGQSRCEDTTTRRINILTVAGAREIELVFEPYQSLLLLVSRERDVTLLDIHYEPPPPASS
jgi:hypothetical protein